MEMVEGGRGKVEGWGEGKENQGKTMGIPMIESKIVTQGDFHGAHTSIITHHGRYCESFKWTKPKYHDESLMEGKDAIPWWKREHMQKKLRAERAGGQESQTMSCSDAADLTSRLTSFQMVGQGRKEDHGFGPSCSGRAEE
eukprot:754557-Hanusia_phi.AAC.1